MKTRIILSALLGLTALFPAARADVTNNVPTAVSGGTGTLSGIQTDDGVTYNVTQGGTLSADGFTAVGEDISSVVHHEKFYVDAGGYRWVRRTATGDISNSGTVPNTWVRLVRSGTTITAYKSSNGTSRTTVGSTTNTTFASTCYIGLAVGSGSDTTLNASQFGNISVTP